MADGDEGDDDQERLAKALRNLAGTKAGRVDLHLLATALGLGAAGGDRGGAPDRDEVLDALQPVVRSLDPGDVALAACMWPVEPADRLRPVQERQRAAAASADSTLEVWRKQPWRSLSRRLAVAVAQRSDGLGAVDAAAELGHLARSGARRRPVLVALGLVAAVFLGLAGYAAVAATRGEVRLPVVSAAKVPKPRCQTAPGATARGAPAHLAAVGRLFARTAGPAAVRCALARVTAKSTTKGSWVYQEVEVAGTDGVGALVEQVDGATALIAPQEWTYFLHASPDAMPFDHFEFYGRLVKRTEVDRGAVLEFENGHVVAYPYRGGPIFFLFKPSADFWRSHGAQGGVLGMPMSDAYVNEDGLRQDFQGGYGVLGPGGTIELFPLAPGTGLPADKALLGHIVSTGRGDEVSWFVTKDRQLTWIDSREAFFACGGDEGVAKRSVPGAALVDLPFAGPADCT